LFGVQGGYDFGPEDQPGFGLRASLTSLLLINRISLDVLYSLRNDAFGAGWYFGIGSDAAFVAVSGTGLLFGTHLVAGYNFALSSSVAAFAELWPLAFFSPGASSGNSILYVSFAAGLNFRL
jgi:hypothetical protein